jgi:hypothetical protein
LWPLTLLQVLFQSLELLLPEGLVLGEPLVGFSEWLSRQLAVGDAADFRARDQSRPFEHTQVFGDTGR